MNYCKKALGFLHIEKEELQIVMLQIEEQFGNFFESHINAQKTLKANLSLVQKKVDKIEERFVLEEIDKAMYTKFKAKYDRAYIDIEKELGNISVNVSNLKKITKFAVEL